MTTNHRAYCLIEPSVYEIHVDEDGLLCLLEVIRQKLPILFLAGNVLVEYDLLKVEGPHGPPYPAIGMYYPFPTDQDPIPDWLEMHQIINEWITNVGISYLIQAAAEVACISWRQLQVQGCYPIR